MCVVNIGAEITSLMIFGRGAVQHTAVFPFGGMHFTKDIAVGLRVSIPEANRIKHHYGCVGSFLMDEEEKQQLIEITPVGRNETRGLSKEILCDIMQPRAVELLQHIAQEVASTQAQMSSGVILTGGGCAGARDGRDRGAGFRCADAARIFGAGVFRRAGRGGAKPGMGGGLRAGAFVDAARRSGNIV